MFTSFGTYKGIAAAGGFDPGNIGQRFIHRGKARRRAIRGGRGKGWSNGKKL
jgi:hypothetical protein